LDTVVAQGGVDEFEEVAQAVVVVDDEDVVVAAAGGFEHVAQGGDLGFGVAQVDVFGAAVAGDDVGPGGLYPAFVGDAAAEGDLVLEGGLVGGGLLFGGDGGEDGEIHGPVFSIQCSVVSVQCSVGSGIMRGTPGSALIPAEGWYGCRNPRQTEGARRRDLTPRSNRSLG